MSEIELVSEPSELRQMVECLAAVFSACATSESRDPARDVRQVRGYFDVDVPATHELLAIAARDGADCVGLIIGFVDHSLGHPQLQEPAVMVRPSHRRMGIGRRLVHGALEWMQSPGSTIVASSGLAGAAAFANALGAVVFQRTVHSAMAAGEADLERLAAIAGTAPEGYELVLWDGLVPAPMAAEFIELFQYMRTAPNGADVPMPASIEEQSEWAESFARSGVQWWTAAAREFATGILAAMTDLQVRPNGTASVLHTVTRPDHRRRGLARWVKASLLTRFFSDPTVQMVITQNAEANVGAIAANRALGMRQTGTTTSWRLRSGAP